MKSTGMRKKLPNKATSRHLGNWDRLKADLRSISFLYRAPNRPETRHTLPNYTFIARFIFYNSSWFTCPIQNTATMTITSRDTIPPRVMKVLLKQWPRWHTLRWKGLSVHTLRKALILEVYNQHFNSLAHGSSSSAWNCIMRAQNLTKKLGLQ